MSKKLSISILTLCFLLLVGGGCKESKPPCEGSAKLAPKEYDQKLNETARLQLIDVRTPKEYEEGHLANAANIDWNGGNFEAEISTLLKETPTFIYCRSGGRSGEAAAKMCELGFKEVYDMIGGITAWETANLSIETSLTSCEATQAIAPEVYSQKLNEMARFQLIDVRTPAEYAEGHLANAGNIDWNGGNFEAEITELMKEMPTFVYCRSGGRSGEAAAKMCQLGFTEIYDMAGGITEWKAKGLPVEK